MDSDRQDIDPCVKAHQTKHVLHSDKCHEDGKDFPEQKKIDWPRTDKTSEKSVPRNHSDFKARQSTNTKASNSTEQDLNHSRKSDTDFRVDPVGTP